MAEKFYIIAHDAEVDFSAAYVRKSRITGYDVDGVAMMHITVEKDAGGMIACYNKTSSQIMDDCAATCGFLPYLVNRRLIGKRSSSFKENTRFTWCVFDHGSALAFAMMVSGVVTEKEWPEGISNEDKIARFHELVVSTC
jgi:hypothetical protein